MPGGGMARCSRRGRGCEVILLSGRRVVGSFGDGCAATCGASGKHREFFGPWSADCLPGVTSGSSSSSSKQHRPDSPAPPGKSQALQTHGSLSEHMQASRGAPGPGKGQASDNLVHAILNLSFPNSTVLPSNIPLRPTSPTMVRPN
ncbi:hypothetical protein L209DRAFT_19148 [Thermothelomyces heterothallicus CBS 203.75]